MELSFPAHPSQQCYRINLLSQPPDEDHEDDDDDDDEDHEDDDDEDYDQVGVKKPSSYKSEEFFA